MTVEIEMTGSGDVGHLAPGWSVQEYATPVVIGETGGGTGNVTLSASARDDSLFIVNNNITTVTDVGSVAGVVQSVSQTGLNVSFTHNTKMSVFDTVMNIPPLGSGGMYQVVDLCSQMAERDILLAAGKPGYFYSLSGHSAGFDNVGNIAKPYIRKGSYTTYTPPYGNHIVSFKEELNTVWAQTFEDIGGKIYSTSMMGDTFGSDSNNTHSRLAFKLAPNSGAVFNSKGFPFDSDTDSGFIIDFSVNELLEQSSIGIQYWSGGSMANVYETADLSSLDWDSELAVFYEFVRPSTVFGTFTLNLTVCNTSDYDTTVDLTATFNTYQPTYQNRWSLDGPVRSVWRSSGSDYYTNFVEEYENAKTFSYNIPIQINGPVDSVETNLWEYMQNACSAYNKELAIVNDTLTVRDVAIREIDITNIVGAPTISPNASFAGRHVEVVYYNNTSIKTGEIYNARDDSNRVISVKSEETITTTVSVSGSPIYVDALQYDIDGSAPIQPGCYVITGASGTVIPQALWEFHGGSVDVAISKTARNAIDITMVGPQDSLEGAGYAGPYKLAYTADGTDYAALSITGSGITTSFETLKLLTGVDQDIVINDVAKTINNIFIDSEERAYDRGIWAATEAAGPRVTLSGTIPVSAIEGLGLVAGSRIRYRDSIYRINDTTIGNLAVSFNASRHVTVQDFDNVWASHSSGLFDEVWTGYDAQDHLVRPLWFIGDDESIFLALDTDFNPYFSFTDDMEISVFYDTDDNPYYIDIPYAPGAEEVYLDIDGNPYVQE